VADRGGRVVKIGRREMIALGLGGGGALALGVWAVRRSRRAPLPAREQAFAPNAFVAVDDDGSVTVWVSKSEMGQGVRTALPMIVAEELDADWSRVRAEAAIAHDGYGEMGTFASTSVATMWDALRDAGAAARAMLIAAAASRLAVEESALRTERGEVIHEESGRRIGYGELAALAATLDVPDDPPRKAASAYRLLGTEPLRIDTEDKIAGNAIYGADVEVDGLVIAAVARPPMPGARLAGHDEPAARAMPGVIGVERIDTGGGDATVAVIAETTWAALRGREALAARWDPPAGIEVRSSDDAMARLRVLAGRESRAIAIDRGDARAALAAAARTFEARYEAPLVAHQPMEPLVATAHVEGDRCTVWAPTQNPLLCRNETAERLGIDRANVTVHTTFLGGGFGRRAEREEVAEAVALSARLGRPVRVQWSREDDVRGDWYRPPAVIAWSAAIDAGGAITGALGRIASPGLTGADSERGDLDPLACEGASTSLYGFPSLRVEWHHLRLPMRLGIWRSVAHSVNAFALERFVDELARALGRDPLELRRSLLSRSDLEGASRLRAVLERAVERARARPLPAGRALGIAAHPCFGSFVAQVAEVSIEGERPKVHRVTCALDCGRVVHPGIVRQQVEGGIAFGLSAALHSAIAFEDGAIVPSNFHDAPILRIDEMPEVDVEIVTSDAPPSGVGELAVPVLAPAVANALAVLAPGATLRTLPITLSEARPG
jgi:isoquinoline 1-oxidoreductase beta subunit